MKIFRLLSLCCLLFFSLSHAEDVCVADLKSGRTPVGYACKDPATVTVEDFVFNKLGSPGNVTAKINASFVPGFVQQFPALNGLGIGLGRADIAPGGFFPLHTHPDATEVIYLESADVVTAGFISSQNVAYIKALKKGDVMVIPKGLLHFVVNIGNLPTTIFVSYRNPNPAVQTVATSLFANDFPSTLLEKTSFLDEAQVKKLKAAFGGTG